MEKHTHVLLLPLGPAIEVTSPYRNPPFSAKSMDGESELADRPFDLSLNWARVSSVEAKVHGAGG